MSEPRTWSMPPEPGVAAVRDRNGRVWDRHGGRWCPTRGGRGRPRTERPIDWASLVYYYGPLTDVSEPTSSHCGGTGHDDYGQPCRCNCAAAPPEEPPP